MGIYDDGVIKFNDEVWWFIVDLGSIFIINFGFRDNWVFCGGKGIKIKSFFE